MIHGGDRGKSVMLVKNNDDTRMEEGEYFAIETFGSTGRGRVIEQVWKVVYSSNLVIDSYCTQGDCSHYAKIYNAPPAQLRCARTRSVRAFLR